MISFSKMLRNFLPYVIFFAPLIGAALAGLAFIKTRSFFAQVISSFCVFASCAASAIVCYMSVQNGQTYDIKIY